MLHSHFAQGEIETLRAEARVSEISDANPDLPVLTQQLLSSSLFSTLGEEVVTLLSHRPKDSWELGEVSHYP